MKGFLQGLAIIAIMLVIAAMMYRWTQRQINTLAEKLRVIELEIQQHLESLRLSKEMKTLLDRKVILIFRTLKLIVCFLLLGVWFIFFRTSYDVMNSLFDASNFISLTYITFSYMLFNKVMDGNTLTTITKKRIQVIVYKKYGFNPAIIGALEKTIHSKTKDAEELRKKLQN